MIGEFDAQKHHIKPPSDTRYLDPFYGACMMHCFYVLFGA